MIERTVSVTLPEPLYERVRETATASARSLQEILIRSIALLFPPLEDDLPAELRPELAALSVANDAELRRLAEMSMSPEQQARLEALAEHRKTRELDASEEQALADLMAEAQRLMLHKAEAYRLLARRGYQVFPSLPTIEASSR
ncbi:MAG: hypothetical protein HC897_12140 [Thermoanaerobaculia bacterium]|nr:hypothetical protein [Thermoanaerobaculia bacterium]